MLPERKEIKPAAPVPEKTHYSVDDMLGRLRDTQAKKDGKSRRRRSGQPAEPDTQKRLLWLCVWLILGVVLSVGAIVALGFVNGLRYEGEGFRRDVSDRVSQLTGLETEFAAFQVNGRTLSSGQVQMEKNGDGLVSEINAKVIEGEATLGSFFSDSWQIKPLDIHEIIAVFSPPDGLSAPVASGYSEKQNVSSFGFGLSSKPKTLSVDKVRIKKFNVVWKDDAGESAVISEAQLNADVFGGKTTFEGREGTFQWGNLLPWKIKHVKGSARGNELVISRARLSHDKGDELLLKGEMNLSVTGDALFKGTIGKMPLKLIVPEFWKERMTGKINAVFEYNRGFTVDGAPELRGAFELNRIVLRDLPMLDTLAVYAAESAFSFVEIPALKGNFLRKSDGNIVISEFEVQRVGLVRIGGEIKISPEGTLDGILDVGLPDATFDKLRGGRPDFFITRGDDGFSWAQVALGGTVNQPQEDLTPRLKKLWTREQQLNVKGGAPDQQTRPPRDGGKVSREQQLEDVFDQLIQPR